MRTIVFLIVLGQLFQSFNYVFLVARGKSVRVSDIIFAFVCLFLYFLCVKANPWKLLFLSIFILNYIVTIRGICFFAESWLFYDPNITFYSLHTKSMLICFALLLLTVPFGLLFMEKDEGPDLSGRQPGILEEDLVSSIFRHTAHLHLQFRPQYLGRP